MSKKRVFGELELTILKVFKSGQKLTVREVLNVLGQNDKYTTIMTVMNRLVDKKHLSRNRHGQQYEYWLNESKKTAPSGFLEKLKQKIFGGNSASMVSYLLESGSDITDSELADMEKLIEEIRKSRKL